MSPGRIYSKKGNSARKGGISAPTKSRLALSTEFGRLLRQHRLAAELSQEGLAAAAGISLSAIGAYERGIHAAPHRHTIGLLADALSLTGQQRLDFEVVAKRKPRRPMTATANEYVVTALPVESTSFFGRELELARLQDLLRGHRLVTVTGAAGIGKTRLALRAAAVSEPCYRDGIAFADLGSIGFSTSVIGQIALAAGVASETMNRPEDLATRLNGRELLVFVDNCEHVIEAVAGIISAILKYAPSVKVLTTSRERLRIGGEAVFRVPTLPVPETSVRSAQQISGIPSVELFVDRATNIDSGFMLTDGRAEAISDICRQLDGIPLALELAAVRLSTLGLSYLRDQVQRTIAVLSVNNRDVPTHQSTLEDTLAWSHSLLTAKEQILFRRLSIFVGSWTTTAAEAVCAYGDLPVDSIVPLLTSLVDKSPLTVDIEPVKARYDFLQVTRHFARVKAAGAGETDILSVRHAQWVIERVSEISEAAFLKEAVAPHMIELGIEDVRSAAEWSLDTQKPHLTSDMLWGSSNLFYRYGLIREHLDLCRRALADVDEHRHVREAAQLHSILAVSAPIGERVRSAERAVYLRSELGEERWIALAMITLAWALTHVGRYVEAEQLARSGLVRFERCGFDGSVAFARGLRAAGHVHYRLGDLRKAREYVRRAALLSTQLHQQDDILRCLSSESEFNFLEGDHRGALEVADRGIVLARQIGFRREEMYLMTTRAAYLLVIGDVSAARKDAETALQWAANNDRVVTLTVIQHLATVAALSQKPELAATLLGFSDRELKDLGGNREPTEEICYRILVDSLASQCAAAQIDALMDEGSRLTLDGAIRLASTV